MYSDENRSVALAKYLNGFDYAVIDTCSLMEDSFAEWMDILTNAKIYLANSNVRIYIIDECIEELKKHSKNKEDFDRSVVAKRALKIIRQAKWKRLLKIRRSLSKNDRHFADPAITSRKRYWPLPRIKSSPAISVPSTGSNPSAVSKSRYVSSSPAETLCRIKERIGAIWSNLPNPQRAAA